MRIRGYFRLTCVISLILSLTLISASRRAETRPLEGEAWAIKGGTVVTVTGATIPNGTVVIRNGLIEAVGADIAIPGDARVIDAAGMTVYPGLIDSYTSYGIRPPEQPQRGSGAGGNPAQAFVATTSAAQPNAGLLPETTVADQLQVSAETFDQQRSAGITAALSGLRDGVFRGQTAFINLGDDSAEKLILKAPASLSIAFTGSRGGYPQSLMGVFSFLRQSLLDAQHYRDEWARYNKSQRGMTRPAVNKSLASLQPVINGELPVILNAGSAREMKRAVGLAEEFNLKYMLAGATESYAIADWLKQKNATVLLSLSFPQKPQGLEDPESEPLRVLRERAEAPKSAAALHKAGVRFAFQSGSLARPQDFIANAARAIEAGLPKEEALKALTIYPAQIFGVSEQLGSIEKGKIANLIVTSGDLFARDMKVRHVFVDGKPYAVKAPETARPAGPGRGPRGGGGATPPAAVSAAGVWTLTVNSPQGQLPGTLTLHQEGETITGETTTPFGTVPISDGKINGSEITFSFKVNSQDHEMLVTATGRIEGNSITGTMNAMGQSFDFSGNRKPQ